jgi:CRP-like cAMP-binding protein
MTTRHFDAGTLILRQGSSAVALYVILAGKVEISHAPEEGGNAPPIALVTLGPGECFGEMALVDDQARSADVTAIEPTSCALLSRWEFQQELRRSPEVALALIAILSGRIRQLDERLSRYEAERISRDAGLM